MGIIAMPSSVAIKLLDLIQFHRITAVIYVAAKLGLAELLRDGPRSLDELARATGAHQQALGRLMTALSTVGICARVDEDHYSLTELGSALDGSAAQSVKAWAIFEGEMLAKSWNAMFESIMTGKTAAQLLGFDSSFELMSRSPENVSIFNAAMVDLTRLVTPDILRAFDFGHISHLMDVGGGSGELIGAIAKEYPRIRGTVFDLPRCADTANKHFQRVGISDRAQFLSGDFFETIPAIADAIILKSVIHDWNDERSSVILRNCRKALPENGTLLLVERMMPERPTTQDVDKAHAMSDLNMLRGPGGLERSEKQYCRLLDQNGFRQTSIRSAGRFSVIEARVR
jgi:DNA-binding HxlR family transcriptional regulator/ubiquinone/menaquinone biosynthesis C-methylase UbiE